jgi:uroporphyrinogen-III synthase
MIAFISRVLTENSPFAAILQTNGWQVRGASLLRLSPVDWEIPPPTDWIFFASRAGVAFFFDRMPVVSAKIAAIGPGTAEALSRYVPAIDFTGTGDPESTARLFGPIAVGQRVLFPGARHSRQNVQTELGDQIEGLHLPIYDNVPRTDPPAQTDAAVLAFTSSLNVQAYFSHHAPQPGQRMVAIGRPTAVTLSTWGLDHIRLAEQPSEAGLARAVLAVAADGRL